MRRGMYKIKKSLQRALDVLVEVDVRLAWRFYVSPMLLVATRVHE